MKRGIMLVSHGKLASELKNSVGMITGSVDDIYCVCLENGEGIEKFTEKLNSEIGKLEDYEEILIFADLYGGSPCNTVVKHLVNDDKYKIISGMNISMVITAVLNTEEEVDSLMNVGRNAIIDVKEIYRRMSNDEEED
ncbi:PTS mannose transporter subunit IIA [Clostridium sp. Marseille-Q2269]|uniref:PTS sugar transporter subunit IIA n=1 Tax=Clostridium sp. Marseille-Q2269 TaxID=2942205 RepID=UPI002072F9E4|nr:PTS mannose transporter subunit IIA [Clostridium sp. Marseille-Q2269]